MPFKIDQLARDRWVQRMDEAVTECGFDEHPTRVLRAFFDASVTFMINTPG